MSVGRQKRGKVKYDPRSRRSARSAEWVDMIGARKERDSKMQVKPLRPHPGGQSYG